MPIIIAIPDDCKPLAEAVERLVACTERAMHRAARGRSVDYAQIEREVGERAAEVERAAHHRVLSALDVGEPAVLIDGRLYTGVHRDERRYYTLAGDVVVTRSLCRAADAVSILAQRPDLHVVLLSDGAPEMPTLLPSTRRRWARRPTNCSTSGT